MVHMGPFTPLTMGAKTYRLGLDKLDPPHLFESDGIADAARENAINNFHRRGFAFLQKGENRR
jgi:hypothetical protein